MGIERLRYHVADDSEEPGSARPAVAFRGGDLAADVPVGPFTSDEGAARFYLDQLLMRDGRPSMRSAAAPDEPGRAAGLTMASAQELNATRTRLVRFEQQHEKIPVFGTEAVVELDNDRALVSADVRVGDVVDVGTQPTIDGDEAVDRVSAFTEVALDAAALPARELVYFHDEDADRWHLAWHVRGVPALPPQAQPDPGARGGHGIGGSFRARRQRADYLVDAHDGEIVYYYGTAPTLMGIPVKCKGTTENGDAVEFLGARVGSKFILHDPLRHVHTANFAMGDIDRDTPPTEDVQSDTAIFGDEHRAAVTAHHHGSLVQDYFKAVLQRDGIDDKGMDLVSIVNTTCPADESPPNWANACWWENRMWYGQVKDDRGRLVSLARYLDVIGHELTHGVIETTAGLVYEGQSGALNESFADIFGILIANANQASVPDDVSSWDWRMGDGLGGQGRPLRNFADPASLGEPAHMDDYVHTTFDLGGVHTNSNIHNKAAHALLTAVDDQGNRVLSVRDAATVLYLALCHLPKTGTFGDAREKALDVAKVYFSGDADRADAVAVAIAGAYDSVGIG